MKLLRKLHFLASLLIIQQGSLFFIEIQKNEIVNSLLDYSSTRPVTIKDENDFSKTLVEGWNAISSAYLEHKSTQIHPGDLIEAPYFRHLIEEYAKNARYILDAATGNGWFTLSILQWNILPLLTRIVGIDISPVMIATARSQCHDTRAEFFCSPLEANIYETIGLSAESLDLIVSSNGIDCIRNVEQVVAQLYRLLKPASYAIISIRHPLRNAYRLTGTIYGEFKEGVYAESWRGTGNQEVIRFYRKETSWDQLFIGSGFDIIEKITPVISESIAKTHPQLYKHNKDRKYPGCLIYVLRRSPKT